MALIQEEDPQVKRLKQKIQPGVRFGSTLLWCFVLFYLVWGGFAPIDSAVIAHGTIVPSENRQLVQHLHGGTISKILVHEGDIVEKGQVLYELSKTQAKAKLQMVYNQYIGKKITEERIIAEREEKTDFAIPQELLNSANDEEIQRIYQAEKKLFDFNLQTFKGQLDLLDKQISLAHEHIEGLLSQSKASKEQLKLVKEELVSVKELFAKKLVQKPRLLALMKNEAELNGRIAEIEANINKAKESINETKLKIEQLSHNRKRELSTELKETQNHIASLKEELDAAQDIETRTKIIAPVTGIVTNAKFHTIDGVVPSGATLAEIVPTDNELIVEARLNPQDIDVVAVGQPAKIMVTAFKARFTPRISGKVVYVSADKQMDERTGQGYYLVRAIIDYNEVKKIGKTILPGMMAEVFIVTGEHTFLEYFLSPITNSLRHAFREK
ncbi:HlyD family type I secretion periplasmic adaptor subunit [Rickettsiales endosymbiont of Stachyamoeba lipophora]|uniref:HlyD family type I secretion periplasmic adaptor subunit n=1 Tax=Rickettsiales endosymbiont of Stachyamoeba lipophora TaxID=2486578 RepID=UPI000F6455BA|nr:HlyD family type I secretion periplasmic adaptor subunit [Rickettsiales endosymbiont of Stachyamoeba lipophora]AZL15365.1 HlyD family type I secretion periplasmic adaptor subunit [Rickettsiales endosymbiont of Stachyamoeba lipophora]